MSLLVISLQSGGLYAECQKPLPLCLIGGGYMDTRKYSCGLIQLEYKPGTYAWGHLRPQMTFLLSQYYSGYAGLGFGWEFYMTKQILMIPNFSTGIYWKGRGRDLGCPLEFQSALELAYEMENKVRIGIQISHVSNAHLSERNPGFNALTLRVAFPLNFTK